MTSGWDTSGLELPTGWTQTSLDVKFTLWGRVKAALLLLFHGTFVFRLHWYSPHSETLLLDDIFFQIGGR